MQVQRAKFLLLIALGLSSELAFSQENRYLTSTFREKITIQNKSNSTKVFKLAINEQTFYSSIGELTKVALNKALNAEDSVINIWKFVAKNTYHFWPYTGDVWAHHPLLMFNSLGFGFCDDVAKTTEYLWTYSGYDARTWYLNGHVVPEVELNGTWQLYDPDLFVFFKNQGKVLSREDLSNNPDIILNSANREVIDERADHYTDEFWKYIASIYGKGGSIDASKISLDSNTYDYSFALPSESLIQLNVGERKIESTKISKRYTIPSYILLTIKIPKTEKYNLSQFLAITKIKGNGKIIFEGKEYNIRSREFQKILTERQYSLSGSSIFKGKNLQISYLINKSHFQIGKKNTLELSGDNFDGIEIKKK